MFDSGLFIDTAFPRAGYAYKSVKTSAFTSLFCSGVKTCFDGLSPLNSFAFRFITSVTSFVTREVAALVEEAPRLFRG